MVIAGSGRAGVAGRSGSSTAGLRSGLAGRVVGSGRCRWAERGVEQLGPGGLPGPSQGEVQAQPAGGVGQPGGNGDQLGADGAGGRPGMELRGQRAGGPGEGAGGRGGAAPARVRLNAMAASASQAEFAANFPEGRWASGPALRSALTCSMIACCRWVVSAASIGSRESAETAAWGEAVDSAAAPAGTDAGFSRLTRRTINRALMWSHLRREVNAVNSISATSGSEVPKCSCAAHTA